MQDTVMYAGLAFGVAVFGMWLVAMVRADRAHRLALVEDARARTDYHRQAAVAARYVPGAPVVARAEIPVVRAGSFCRVPGNVGQGKDGTMLVCEEQGTGRPRWRRAEVLEIAS
jgi:hypothetical protein